MFVRILFFLCIISQFHPTNANAFTIVHDTIFDAEVQMFFLHEDSGYDYWISREGKKYLLCNDLRNAEALFDAKALDLREEKELSKSLVNILTNRENKLQFPQLEHLALPEGILNLPVGLQNLSSLKGLYMNFGNIHLYPKDFKILPSVEILFIKGSLIKKSLFLNKRNRIQYNVITGEVFVDITAGEKYADFAKKCRIKESQLREYNAIPPFLVTAASNMQLLIMRTNLKMSELAQTLKLDKNVVIDEITGAISVNQEMGLLDNIAKKYQISVEDLREMNKIPVKHSVLRGNKPLIIGYVMDKLYYNNSFDSEPQKSLFYFFPNLRELDISFNLLEKLPDELFLLNKLEYLNVSFNDIANLLDLKRLKNLKKLIIKTRLGFANQVLSDDDLKKLKAALPNCQIIY